MSRYRYRGGDKYSGPLMRPNQMSSPRARILLKLGHSASFFCLFFFLFLFSACFDYYFALFFFLFSPPPRPLSSPPFQESRAVSPKEFRVCTDVIHALCMCSGLSPEKPEFQFHVSHDNLMGGGIQLGVGMSVNMWALGGVPLQNPHIRV